MTDRARLLALHKRVAAEQERLVLEAAALDTLPADRTMDRIARAELVLSAIEAVIEKRQK